MKRNLIGKRMGIAFVCLGSLLLLFWSVSPRDGLLQHATLRASVGIQQKDWGDWYWWLSNHVVVLCRDTDYERLPPHFVRKDLNTGVEHPLPALTHLCATSGGALSQMYPSPDGQWVLWECEGKDDLHPNYCGANLEGSQVIRWQSRFMDIHWSHDNRHWIEFVPDTSGNNFTRALIRNIDKPSLPQVIPLKLGSLNTTKLGRGIVFSDDHILMEDSWNGGISSLTDVTFEEFSLEKGGHTMRTFNCRLPQNEAVEKIIYSPQGDRVAWVLTYAPPVPTVIAFLHRVFPNYKAQPSMVMGLWVSRLDGSAMHEIGHIPAISPYERIMKDDENEIDDVRWLPEGKELSFYYKDGLYTVPAD